MNIQGPAGEGAIKWMKYVHACFSFIAGEHSGPASEGAIKWMKYVHACFSFIAGEHSQPCWWGCNKMNKIYTYLSFIAGEHPGPCCWGRNKICISLPLFYSLEHSRPCGWWCNKMKQVCLFLPIALNLLQVTTKNPPGYSAMKWIKHFNVFCPLLQLSMQDPAGGVAIKCRKNIYAYLYCRWTFRTLLGRVPCKLQPWEVILPWWRLS